MNVRSRSAACRVGAAVMLLVLILGSPAIAQSRFEIGGGISWTAGFDAGGSDALLTRNPATGSSPFALFETSSRVNATPGVTANLGFYLTRRLFLEATADYSRPILRSTISGDVEGATGASAESRLTSVVAGGSVVYRFGESRLTPFVSAGAGWTRQLDEDRIMLVTGAELHAGGGVLYRLSRTIHLHAGMSASSRAKTIGFGDARRVTPVVSAGIRYRF